MMAIASPMCTDILCTNNDLLPGVNPTLYDWFKVGPKLGSWVLGYVVGLVILCKVPPVLLCDREVLVVGFAWMVNCSYS